MVNGEKAGLACFIQYVPIVNIGVLFRQRYLVVLRHVPARESFRRVGMTQPETVAQRGSRFDVLPTNEMEMNANGMIFETASIYLSICTKSHNSSSNTRLQTNDSIVRRR